MLPVSPAARFKPCPNAPISMGSPRGVPVPCTETAAMSVCVAFAAANADLRGQHDSGKGSTQCFRSSSVLEQEHHRYYGKRT